jgi:hypothetical protein
MYATHQAAKYSSIPRLTHGEATLYIVQYLKKTPDLMLKFKPKSDKGFECYCDADFAENWSKEFDKADPSTAKSHSRWISSTEAAQSVRLPCLKHK